MTATVASEATAVLMPYKSMMRALGGMCALTYERCRITVPHTISSPRRNAWDHWERGRSR